MAQEFEILGEISLVETIAINFSIREKHRLEAQFGRQRWRKCKGIGRVRFPKGEIHLAEIHWYEAHGIGRKKLKIKRIL